ncbi:hypothetical protein CKAH01_13333 [Colletotrichum kahawae]|uniref:Uncharacterized protein n=1 Tax=Colletotrichum kahawae TaxID=34407 RepID=A0AAE0DBL5_COLKA|nr:hypothetical protein CKAH01_13333 [Colletotrichum kahawae]
MIALPLSKVEKSTSRRRIRCILQRNCQHLWSESHRQSCPTLVIPIEQPKQAFPRYPERCSLRPKLLESPRGRLSFWSL